MKHPEILAPAGSMEALDAAIAAGADAVYFGLPSFGARAYASNFSLETTKEVIEKLHLFGMKAHVTMNTILYESEIEEAFDMAKALYEMGVDALIVQDLGFIHLLHERLPELEIHASTQLSTNTKEQIAQLKKLGVKRVVLARECSLAQIEELAKEEIEIEVFLHGALCISYSGQCQFSRLRYNRSGNRGMCAQPCRMSYTLLEDGKAVPSSEKFLLSPKDLSLIEDVQALEKAGVASLKIEGRMKSAEYVFESVKMTQKALSGQKLSAQDKKDMQVTFNRGYTKGHAYVQKGRDLMNMKTSNHQGIPLGKVTKIKNGRIGILLVDDLAQNDGIRFESGSFHDGCRVNFLYNEKGLLIREAKKGEMVYIDGPKGVRPGAAVKKTIDFKLSEEVKKEIHEQKRQVPLRARLTCKGAGEVLELSIFDGVHEVKAQSSQPAQKASNKPTSLETVSKQMHKTGNSFGYFENLEIDLPDDLFLPVSMLNDLRRQGLDALAKKRMEAGEKPVKDYRVHLEPVSFSGLFAQIQNPDQKVDVQDVQFVSEFNIEGAAKKGMLSQSNGYLLSHLGQGEIISDLNVTNSYALAALLSLGYKGIVLTNEISYEQMENMLAAFKKRYGFDAPVMIQVYGKERMMIMNHCPVNTLLKDGKRQNCKLCHEHTYILEGKDGSQSLLQGDAACHMCLYEPNASSHIEDIPYFKELGVQAFECVFIDEQPAKIKEILSSVQQSLN
jgi:putative protease